MADLPEREAPPAEGARVARRVAGAAVLGAVMGAALAGIWHAAWRAGLAGGVVGIPAGLLVVVIGSAAGFAVLEVRPLLLTVPAAVLVARIVVPALSSALPGSPPPATWAAATLLAVGLALVALAATPGLPRRAGLVLLAVLLLGAVIIPGRVHDNLQLRQQKAKLAALGFPLVVPRVPGYKIADAYPDAGVLTIDVVRDNARRDYFGTYRPTDAFSVNITTVANRFLSGTLASCLPGGPRLPAGQACHAIGPAQWNISGLNGPLVIARHGRLAVSATGESPGVPIQVLDQATARLWPTTADALVSLR
jgi:hypothetical protein